MKIVKQDISQEISISLIKRIASTNNLDWEKKYIYIYSKISS